MNGLGVALGVSGFFVGGKLGVALTIAGVMVSLNMFGVADALNSAAGGSSSSSGQPDLGVLGGDEGNLGGMF